MINIFKIILLIIIIKKKINQNSRGKYFLSLLTTLQQPEELLSACIHDNQYDQSDLGHQSWSSWSPTFSDSHVTMAIFPIYPSLSIMMCQYLSYVTCHGWSWFKHGPKSVHFTFMLGFKVLVTFACFDCNFFFRKSSRGQAWNHKCPDETTDQMFGGEQLAGRQVHAGGYEESYKIHVPVPVARPTRGSRTLLVLLQLAICLLKL